MLRVYIVTYDICDDKRLRKVFETMKGFGEHVQYSVFRCELSDANKVRLKMALGDILDHRKDQVLIFDMGPVDGFHTGAIESLGVAYTPDSREAIVV